MFNLHYSSEGANYTQVYQTTSPDIAECILTLQGFQLLYVNSLGISYIAYFLIDGI
jgi:hypothetical protein